MRTILPSPEISREEFLHAFKKELQKSTNPTAAVRFIGHTLFITLKADMSVILDRIFAPLVDHLPRWEVRSYGWHHIFINHRTFTSDYPELLTKITSATNVERSRKISKTSTQLVHQKQRRKVLPLHGG